MAINYPTSLDNFTNPQPSDALDSVAAPHATQHSDLNDAVEALEAKVGADSSAVASSLDYKVADHASRITTLEGASGGKILQVVSTTKTDTFSASVAGNGTTSVTGLTVSITPSDAANKVFVFATITGSSETLYGHLEAILTRGGTPIGTGAAAGSRTPINGGMSVRLNSAADLGEATVLYLDSPSSTSALTYGIDILNGSASTKTLYVNRTELDTDIGHFPRSSSTIAVMEIGS